MNLHPDWLSRAFATERAGDWAGRAGPDSVLEFGAMAPIHLLLASNSPRRRELLGLTGWEFRTRPAEIDETPLPGEEPGAYVRRLAEGKARAAGSLALAGEIVLGADTTVADGSLILGKPADAAEAAEMLRRLRGREHRVFTAVALYDPRGGRLISDLCATRVPMRAYTDEEIQRYVASGDPLDKAGAYAIQHPEFHPVTVLRGCFASVMGLPLCHVQRLLVRLGLEPQRDMPKAEVPAACQAGLQYDCSIFPAVLRGEDVG